MKSTEICFDTPPAKDVIRAMRLKHGLTAFTAARMVYVSASAWQRWESGTRTMDLAHWELFVIKVGEHPAAT